MTADPRFAVSSSCLLAALGLLIAAGCANAGAQCDAITDCAVQQVCLIRSQACAAACTSDAQCSGGQKCSGGGGCVAASTCGSDLDCKAGQVCGKSGACEAPCTAASCTANETCGSAGHCVAAATPGTGGTPGNPGGTPGGIEPPPSCGGEAFASSAVNANFLILFDKSGSMTELVSGVTKWSAAVKAVNALAAQHASKMRFGMTLFPVGDTNATACQVAPMSVPIADNSASAIASALAAANPGGKTPLGAVLTTAQSVSELTDPTRANYVLLATDGMETCGGRPVDEVTKLFGKNIKTYVLGFGAGVSASTLTEMAVAGGTARAAAPRYFQVDDPAALSASLDAIVRGVQGCDFTLVKAPPDINKVFVFVNGQVASHDPNKQNGWEYFPGNNRITLYGSACEQISRTPGSRVSLVYGCPDPTVITGGPGQACTTGTQCISGQCTSGACVGGTPGKANGSPCTVNDQCESQKCVNGICEGAQPPGGGLPNGAPCTTSSECTSGLCSAGTCQGLG